MDHFLALVRRVTFLLAPVLLFWTAIPACARAGESPTQSEDHSPGPVILISFDGYRWDYPDLYPTPAVQALARRGLRARALRSAYPTETFPNHYSIATGLWPKNHGIVANKFRDDDLGWYVYNQKKTAQDGRFYDGAPVWVLAEQAGLNTAAYFFVGTEAEIAGMRPDRWHHFDNSVQGPERVAATLEWLAAPADERPHLVTLYFEDVDKAAHTHGPDSAEARDAIESVDQYLQQLLDGLERLGLQADTTIVLVSDHGQARYREPIEPLLISELLDLHGWEAADGGTFVHLYAIPGQSPSLSALEIQAVLSARWDCGHAWTSSDAPRHWRMQGNARFPDLVIQADPGCSVASAESHLAKIKRGAHGWDPAYTDMWGILLAAGPGIPAGLEMGEVDVVDVLPLLLRQLGIPLPDNLDSDVSLWSRILNP